MTGFSGRAETKALIHQSTLHLQVLAEVRRYLIHDRFLLKILPRGGYGWGAVDGYLLAQPSFLMNTAIDIRKLCEYYSFSGDGS